MRKGNDTADKYADLRQRAKKILSGPKENLPSMPPDDMSGLLHELDTCQIELELQNEDLRQAQKELEQSRQKYINLYDFAPVGYLTTSNKGLILEANLRVADMLGVARRDLFMQPLFRFIAPEDQGIYYHSKNNLMATKEPQTYELRLRKKDRSLFHAQLTSTLTEDNSNSHQFRTVITDIHARKQAVEELHKHRWRLNKLLASRTAALLKLSGMLDADFKSICQVIHQEIITITDSVYAFYGFLDEEQREVTVFSWSPGVMEDCRITEKPLVFSIKKSGIWGSAVREKAPVIINDYKVESSNNNKMPAGHVKLTRILSVPVIISGRVLAVAMVANKVTEYTQEDASKMTAFLTDAQIIISRKDIEERLRQLKERYQAIVMDQYDMICRFDPQGRLTFVNDAYCRCFGVKYKEILGTNFIPNIYKEDLPLVEDHFKDLTTLQPGKIIEHRVILPNGQIRWQQWSGRALFDRHGNLVECQAVGQDITDRKQMENELKHAKQELEKRVEERTRELLKTHKQLLHAEKLSAIGKLSASISHEFNNPLAGITNVIHGIKDRASYDDEDARLLDLAIRECTRIKDLIANLQDFNRPSAGKLTTVDLHFLIDSLLILSKKEFLLRKIEINKQYDTNLPFIRAVADQIKQVILNLLTNAIDAIEGSGVVTVCTEAYKDSVRLKIQDSGQGIPQKNISEIFEPFFTTKPAVKGTGLGLSVSYGIIKKHGGTIDVESEVGTGTIFSITLPIKGADNAELADPAG